MLSGAPADKAETPGGNDLSNATSENIIDGMWLVENTNIPETGLVFECSSCSVSFEDRISYEIHLQGLKHKEADKVQSVSPDVNKKLKHLSQLETILHEDGRPLLGLNYVTEYFHARGRHECVCNLCHNVFDSINAMSEHIFNASHIINFMFIWDKQMYEAVKHKDEESFIIQEAKKLETSRKERTCRSKIMEELGNVWVEFQHEGFNSCTDQAGHQLSREYDSQSSLRTIELNKFEDMMNEFKRIFLLSNGLPPSCGMHNFNKISFLDILSKMDIRNEKDADVCLQLANFLTLSLLKYRTKQVKNMKSVGASSVKAKLNFLMDEAERIAEKLKSRTQ